MFLFVYGTLKKGFTGNLLLEDSEFIGEAITYLDYTLYDSGFYPMLIDKPTAPVVGELYWIKPDMVSQVDEYEGCPDLYKRFNIPVLVGDEVICAYAYFYQRDIIHSDTEVPLVDEAYEWSGND